MNLTNFLKLRKPLSIEKYDIHIFNSNSDTIDSAVSGLTEKDIEIEHSILELKNEMESNKAVADSKLKSHTENNNVHFTLMERQKLNSIETQAQVNTITGIKGSKEKEFRTGNIILSPHDIGADEEGSSLQALKDSQKYTDETASGKVDKTQIDGAKGISPLDENRKIPSANIPFGSDPGTCFEGSAGQKFLDDLDNLTAVSEVIHKTLSDSLSSEAARAIQKENLIDSSLMNEIDRAKIAESSISQSILINKPIWDDKYTKNEVDNKFSVLESNIDWKESVNTFGAIASAYPKPQDGWTVNVKDTDYTYRYSGTEWVAISANAIPKATSSIDGLLSKEDKIRLDDAAAKQHIHSNHYILNGITQTIINNWNLAVSHISDAIKHITAAERTNWTDAYNKRHEHGNKPVLDSITQAIVDKWNTVSNKVDKETGKGLSSNDYTTNEKTKLAGIGSGANNYVHPSTSGNKHVPSGGTSGQILRWSADGTAAWGTDNNTTYGVATNSALGLIKGGTDITVDSSGNVSVNDDSHNHIISNVDGLQAALDGKSATSHTHNYAGSSTAGGAATSALVCTGNSATSTKLQTATTINGTSFNGSANITTANWGTSRNIKIGVTSKVVNGSGDVTWTLDEIGAFPVSGGILTGHISMNHSHMYLGTNQASTYMRSRGYNNQLGICGRANGQTNDFEALLMQWISSNSMQIFPGADNTCNFGLSSYRWKTVYSGSGVITTSDRTKKKDICSLDPKITKKFILGLNPSQYKFIDGESHRTHYGLIAQDVEELLEYLDLSSLDFAGFIKSPKLQVDNSQEGIHEIPSEFEYALRYEEFIAPLIKMVQMQQKEINELKDRINTIESLALETRK